MDTYIRVSVESQPWRRISPDGTWTCNHEFGTLPLSCPAHFQTREMSEWSFRLLRFHGYLEGILGPGDNTCPLFNQRSCLTSFATDASVCIVTFTYTV